MPHAVVEGVVGCHARRVFSDPASQVVPYTQKSARRVMSVIAIFQQLPQRPALSLIEQVDDSCQPLDGQPRSHEDECPNTSQHFGDSRMRPCYEHGQPDYSDRQ